MKKFILFLFCIQFISSLTSQVISQNKKKMFGVLDSLGKEVIPFLFTKIEESAFIVDKYTELLSEGEDKLYTTYIGKKKGLYSLRRGELIPAIYEKIDYMYDNGFRVDGYLVSDYGKKGYYNPLGKMIAPCEFDLIECLNKNSDYFKIMVGTKKGKWYSWHYDQWEQVVFEPIDYSIGYEFILGKQGYVRDYIHYDSYDVGSKMKTGKGISEPIELSNDFYILFCHDGKCGAKSKTGEIILEPNNELIQFDSDNKNTVVISKNNIIYKVDLKNNKKSLLNNDQY